MKRNDKLHQINYIKSTILCLFCKSSNIFLCASRTCRLRFPLQVKFNKLIHNQILFFDMYLIFHYPSVLITRWVLLSTVISRSSNLQLFKAWITLRLLVWIMLDDHPPSNYLKGFNFPVWKIFKWNNDVISANQDT